MMDTDDMGGLVAIAAIGGLVVFSGGGIGEIMGGGAGAQLKADRSEMLIQNVASQAKQEFLGGRSEIAETRYREGCQVHYRIAAVQQPEHVARGQVTIEYLNVVEGDQPVNPTNDGAYSANSVVCDVFGGTVIIGPDGVATDGASAPASVAQAYARDYFLQMNQNLGAQ